DSVRHPVCRATHSSAPGAWHPIPSRSTILPSPRTCPSTRFGVGSLMAPPRPLTLSLTTEEPRTVTHDAAPLTGLPDVVADTPAATELRRPPEPTTTTGENAGVILGAWIKFVYDSTGIPIPPAVRGRLGKRIKICITTGYTTEQIKWGLAAWLVTRMDDP